MLVELAADNDQTMSEVTYRVSGAGRWRIIGATVENWTVIASGGG